MELSGAPFCRRTQLWTSLKYRKMLQW